MSGQLLREYVQLQYDKVQIQEAIKKQAPIIVSALIQRADAVNQNNRVYPREILEREINNYMKPVREGRAMGELDHPDSSVVSLENVSHIIREVWWDGANVMGRVEILNTPKGKIAQSLMESGVQLGISSRAVGDVQENENGNDVVDDSLMLVAFDLVSEPSTQNAFLMGESKNLDLATIRRMVPKVDRVSRIVNEILGN